MSRGEDPVGGPSERDDEELVLSPSETMAHDSAMRISGAGRGQQSTQRTLASIVLGFELVIVVLIGLSLFGLAVLEPRELGLYIGGGLALLIVVALGIMRRGRAGIILGWIVHLLMLATAILLPMALIVGLLFTGLWIYCMVKGARIDRARIAWMESRSDSM